MKLADIRIAKGYLTDQIYAGTLAKDGKTWTQKTEVTGDFITAVLARWGGFRETLTDQDGNRYEITARKLKDARHV